MKRFLIWIALVIFTAVAVDMVLGAIFERYIQCHTLPGDYESVEKVLRHSDSELLVLGSSVALNSLNTRTLEDSLHIKTYNGGGNGQEFPFFISMLKGAIESHTPSKVILCLLPNAMSTEGLGPRYNLLVPYYGLGIADIDSNMNYVRPHNRRLLKLTSYRFNNIWFRILLYHFVTPDIRGEKGHIAKPIPPVFPTRSIANIDKMSDDRKTQLTEFMDICRENNIELIILFTPVCTRYGNINTLDNNISEVIKLAASYDVHVYNDVNLRPFDTRNELFYDNAHININGTAIYTDTLINRLKAHDNK